MASNLYALTFQVSPQGVQSLAAMIKDRSLGIVVPLLLLLSTPTVSMAQLRPTQSYDQRPQPLLLAQELRRRPEGRGKAEWLKDLNLSPEQKRQLQAISRQYRPQIAQRMQTLRQLRDELHTLMSGTATTAVIRNKYRQIETLQQDLRRLRFESILSLREILTPQQRQQFEAHMRRRYREGQGQSSP